MEGTVAIRYAKGLFRLALERNEIDKVADDVMQISKTFGANQNLVKFIENPVIKESQKKKLLRAIFEGKVTPYVLSLFDLIIEKNREVYLKAIFRNLQMLYKEHKGYKEIVLTTATVASEEVKKDLAKKISKKMNAEIRVESVVDDKIIGGFVLRIDDLFLDKSISTQLKNIKKELLSK